MRWWQPDKMAFGITIIAQGQVQQPPGKHTGRLQDGHRLEVKMHIQFDGGMRAAQRRLEGRAKFGRKVG